MNESYGLSYKDAVLDAVNNKWALSLDGCTEEQAAYDDYKADDVWMIEVEDDK